MDDEQKEGLIQNKTVLEEAGSILESKPSLGLSGAEVSRLELIKKQVEEGKIGGKKDKPSKNLGGLDIGVYPKIPDWERIDPSKKQISPEKWEEVAGRKMFEHATDEERGLHQIDVIVPGSVSEIYYKILQEKFPQLGIRTELVNPKVDYGASMRVFINPGHKSAENTEKIKKLLHADSLVKALNIDGYPDLAGNTLFLTRYYEEYGILPKDAAKKAQARMYLQEIKEYKSNLNGDEGNDDFYKKRIENSEMDIKSLGVEPYTDEEIRQLIEPVIEKEWIQSAASSGEK